MFSRNHRTVCFHRKPNPQFKDPITELFYINMKNQILQIKCVLIGDSQTCLLGKNWLIKSGKYLLRSKHMRGQGRTILDNDCEIYIYVLAIIILNVFMAICRIIYSSHCQLKSIWNSDILQNWGTAFVLLLFISNSSCIVHNPIKVPWLQMTGTLTSIFIVL
jgi:hypothetical protein